MGFLSAQEQGDGWVLEAETNARCTRPSIAPQPLTFSGLLAFAADVAPTSGEREWPEVSRYDRRMRDEYHPAAARIFARANVAPRLLQVSSESDTGTSLSARCSKGMPRYYFDIADGALSGTDDVGLDFPNLQAARDNAVATLGEIAHDELPDGDHRDFQISIRDEAGQILLTATLALRVDQRA
jgi:hypothetical protein